MPSVFEAIMQIHWHNHSFERDELLRERIHGIWERFADSLEDCCRYRATSVEADLWQLADFLVPRTSRRSLRANRPLRASWRREGFVATFPFFRYNLSQTRRMRLESPTPVFFSMMRRARLHWKLTVERNSSVPTLTVLDCT